MTGAFGSPRISRLTHPRTPVLSRSRAFRSVRPRFPDDFPDSPGFFDFDEPADDTANTRASFSHPEQPEQDLSPADVDTPDDFPDFPRRGPAPPPPPPPPLSGGHRTGGEWRGGHRNDGGRRGVSIGVIAALVAVVVVVGVVILWRFFGDALSNRSNSAPLRRREAAGRRHRRSIDRRTCAAFRGPLQRHGRTGR